LNKKTLPKISENKKKTITYVIILLITFIFLEITSITNILERPLQNVFTPLQLALYKTKQDVSGLFSTITEIGTLRESESKLERENELLLAENASLKKLEKENKALREQLGAKSYSKKLIVTEVIGQDPTFTASELIVDKGESDGVEKGTLVILKNILIGKIVAVGSSTSRVRLLTDSETKIPAVTESGVRGIIKGEFGNKILLDKVAQGKKLKKEELVFSSGEADFPKGLVLGKIVEIDNKPAAIFQKANINPLVPYEELETMFIVERTK
jgi:rod shape-determining protein MreC